MTHTILTTGIHNKEIYKQIQALIAEDQYMHTITLINAAKEKGQKFCVTTVLSHIAEDKLRKDGYEVDSSPREMCRTTIRWQ